MLDLSKLNSKQKEAVLATDGPLLVLAGAGSGKTSVLTYRIAYIVDSGLAAPENILAMTFTNKAAGEMKERILKILKDNANKTNSGQNILNIPWMGTFHSIGVRILKIYGNHIGIDPNFSIYDPADAGAVVKEAMQTLHISLKDINPKTVLRYISSAKNELIDEFDYQSFTSGYIQQTVAEVYPLYQKLLRESNALDFDDLIMLFIKLLQQSPQVLENLQNNFKYILVDEYQDTNRAQNILINLLAAKHKNICVVGDDDQSIYSFRGATIKNILNFEREYKNCKVVKLEQNYRSTKKILEASYQVISKNKARKEKKLWTENLEGESIVLYTATDEVAEAKWVISNIEKNKEEIGYEDVAILYRTNAQSRSLEEAFINSGIPYRIIGAVRFYERKEIKDIIAYLRYLYNLKDSKSLERIVNNPRRGIGPKTILEARSKAREQDLTLGELLAYGKIEMLNPKLQDFAKLIRRFVQKAEQLTLVDLINYILDQSGYLKMLDDGTSESEGRVENLKELITVASRFETMEPKLALETFLDEVSLLEGFDEEDPEMGKVTLMTIHSAKGLEFKYVYVVGVEEGIFPHTNSMFDKDELEEERRLAYVAITRAKEKLHLTHATNRKFFGNLQSNKISRFLEDIDPSLIQKEGGAYILNSESQFDDETEYIPNQLNLRVGDKVKHEYFGVGIVKMIDDDVIDIDFGTTHGVKELMLEYARLEKL